MIQAEIICYRLLVKCNIHSLQAVRFAMYGIVRFWLMIAVVVFCPVGLFSQDKSSDVTLRYYEFIRYSKNKFTGCDTSENYNHFLQLFDSLLHHKNFQINIVHIGGSHIQADVYSHYIREKLHSLDTSLPGTRGMIFPFKIAGTNNPSNYQVEFTGKWQGFRNSISTHQATWGVSGITITTQDTLATIFIALKHSSRPLTFTAIRVFHNAGNRQYELMFKDSSQLKKTSVNYEEDFTLFDLKQPVDSFELIIKKNNPDSTTMELYGILLESKMPGIVYHSIGVNGASFKSYLRCEKFEQQLKYLKPDLVIISIGTNDTFDPDFDTLKFNNRYDSLLTIIRKVNPNAAFLLTVPNDSYINKKEHNRNTVWAESVIENIADKYGYKVWNFYQIMGGRYSAAKWFNAGLMKPDRVHFTQEGYLLKGRLFFDAFMGEYWKWLETKLNKTDPK